MIKRFKNLSDADEIIEIKRELQNQSLWASIRRYIGALFIYLIYWLTIWGALRQIACTTLFSEDARELVESNVIDSVWEYGWGDHYIWFLIALGFATYCSAVLAGATAKKKGAVVGGIASLPIVVLLSFICFFLYTSKIELESQVAWKIVLPISILVSLYLSIKGAITGEKWQNRMFESNTILGIRPLHWWWLIFPLNLAIQELVPRILATLVFLVGSTSIRETKYSVFFFLMFVSSATSIYFIVWGWYKSFRLLSRGYRTNLSKSKIAVRVLFYLFGIPILFDVFYILIYILIGRFS